MLCCAIVPWLFGFTDVQVVTLFTALHGWNSPGCLSLCVVLSECVAEFETSRDVTVIKIGLSFSHIPAATYELTLLLSFLSLSFSSSVLAFFWNVLLSEKSS